MKGFIVGGVAFVVIALVAAFSSVVIINAGEVGVVRRLGEIRENTLPEGMHWTVPFVDSVNRVDVRVQITEVEASAATRDLQDVSIAFAVNYSVDPTYAVYLQRTVGSAYEFVVLQPAIQESLKANVANYTSEEIITRRSEVADGVLDRLQRSMAPYGIIIREINITDLRFSHEFNQAIEARNVAEIEVRTAQQELARIEVEAQQRIVEAEAEAEVMRLQNQEITPEVLQKKWIQNWNGILPTVMGGDSTMMLPIELPTANGADY